MPAAAEVLIVGAGVAGLTCALALESAGVHAHVLEAGEAVGGRIRTDRVDGFLLDRGFQVLNPAYPRVRHYADLDALEMRSFGAGLGLRSPRFEELQVVADPRREPQLLARTIRSGKLHPSSVAALARWLGPALVPDWAIEKVTSDDLPRGESMDQVSLVGPLRGLIDRFLEGVLLEDDGSSSTAFTRMMVRYFSKGRPGLPTGGMQALPEQLADKLLRPVELGTRVVEVGPGKVRTEGGAELSADLVVVAAGPEAAAALTGAAVPPGKGVTTHWFAVDEAPTDLPMVIVDARGEPHGPVVSTAVMSHVAPDYAPAGRHLVQASSLLRAGGTPVSDEEVRAHLKGIYSVDTSPASWELIRRDDIPYALPVQPAPFVPERDMEIDPGLIVAGDWVDHASIQGAMASGERAAQGWLRRTDR
ncbi:MAG: NAD(P)/FAD-dependent oxidoreductase [Ornithinimicrobium sp.]|uniref:NAD(P)/FAD-dependent oxidoreductase n=1 Tax=Ornithinimicrobium sp. TaxID=1977084 RepID=UPI0026DF203D|nr:NAD(P)/FAD-dependent oxidoreductase [Ornithinimicrobium sp.]MDO5740131.1 NAD(P)/FAD-dependent oxidoreductase [Ornithinimicrobium sp.]